MGIRKWKSWNNGFGRAGDTGFEVFTLRDELGDKTWVRCSHIRMEAMHSGVEKIKVLRSYCTGTSLKD